MNVFLMFILYDTICYYVILPISKYVVVLHFLAPLWWMGLCAQF